MHRANPNMLCGGTPTQNLTPIHLAKTKELVRVLLEYGADPYLENVDSVQPASTGKDSNPLIPTLLQRLLKVQPKGAQELFDDAITTNGEDINSENLLVILDYKHFHHEGLTPLQRQKLTRINTKLMVPYEFHGELLFSYKIESDEMSFHKKLLKVKANNVLEHPLSDSFLYIQWTLTKPLFFMNLLLYGIFLTFITALILYQTYLIRCTRYDPEDINISSVNVSGFPDCTCQRICADVSGHDEDQLDFNAEIDCYWRWERKNSEDHFTKCHSTQEKNTEYALFAISILGWLFLCFREGKQFVRNWKEYLNDKENWAEVLLLLCSASYLILLFMPNIDEDLVHHLSSWSVFIAWIDVTLLMGRLPNIGATIQMCFHVVKSVLLLIAVFLPIFLAFGFAFHVILLSNVQFESPEYSVMKILTMMAGEFDFYDNFSYDASSDDNAFGSNQLLFLLSFMFVTIIIMNLLIGLTVSKLEELTNKGAIYRLQQIIELVISSSEILKSDEKGTVSINIEKIPKSCQKFIFCGRLFPLLRYYINNLEHKSQNYISATKLCFKPNKTKASYKEEKHKSRFHYFKWPLYLYNETTKDKDKKLPLSLNPIIVDKIIRLLTERDIRQRATTLKRIQEAREHFNLIRPDSKEETFVCVNCRNLTKPQT